MNAKWIVAILISIACLCIVPVYAVVGFGGDCGQSVTVFPGEAIKLTAAPNNAPTWEYAWSAEGPNSGTNYVLTYGGSSIVTSTASITFNAPQTPGYYKVSVIVGPNFAKCKETKCYQIVVVDPTCPTTPDWCESDFPTTATPPVTGPTITRVNQGLDDSLVTYHWYLDPSSSLPTVGSTYAAPTGSTASGSGISWLIPWTNMPIATANQVTQTHHLFFIVEDKTGTPGVVRQACDIVITIFNTPTSTLTASSP